MYKHSRFAGVLGCMAAFATAGCATNSSVTPPTGSMTRQQARGGIPFSAGWIQKDGILYHAPHYMVTREQARLVKPNIVLTYYGGPVQVTPKAFLVF